MKYFIFLLISHNILFATNYTWSCVGESKATSIYNYSTLLNNPIGSFGFENEPSIHPILYGEMDTVNTPMTYWDDSSPVCGGSSNVNNLIDSYCDDSIDSNCWDVLVGVGQNSILEYTNGYYSNSVILVNGFPCLPRNTSNFTFGAYEWDTNTDIGFANVNLNKVFSEIKEDVNNTVANTQRNQCGDINRTDIIAYVDELESQKQTQYQEINKTNNTITSLKNFTDLKQQIENNLTNISTPDTSNISNDTSIFNTTVESTLTSTFNNYSDAFGFSGYGSAPENISFNLFGNNYNVFDASIIEPHIDLFRDTFLSFSYIWGFLIVLKDFRDV